MPLSVSLISFLSTFSTICLSECKSVSLIIAFSLEVKGSWATNVSPYELYLKVYPAIPVVLWYALDKPPSIINNFPLALIGLSPALNLTGICPQIIWPLVESIPNSSKTLIDIFSSFSKL